MIRRYHKHVWPQRNPDGLPWGSIERMARLRRLAAWVTISVRENKIILLHVLR